MKGLDGETTETTKTDYYYQDGTVLYTKDADGNRSSMNLLGTSANVIATSRGTGDAENWYLYNKDIRESTTSIIDAKGSAAATYQYDDFGNTTITNGADFDNEICYTGQIYDKSSGLYYYNARYYDPENARFITQDTYRGESTQPDTLHLYAYCANNPINYTDPSGHAKISWKKKIIEKLRRNYWYCKGYSGKKYSQLKIGCKAKYLIKYSGLGSTKKGNCNIYTESLSLCNEYYELMVDMLLDGAVSATKLAIAIVRGVLYGKADYLDMAMDALDTAKARAKFKDYKKRWGKRYKKVKEYYETIKVYGKKY